VPRGAARRQAWRSKPGEAYGGPDRSLKGPRRL
jgi:hypothetical protein